MSHVHYKFKSSVDHDTVTFDGLSISLGDLKKAIMTRSKLPKSSDFDLQVVNAQTNEVYKSDTDLIGRNTSVIVTRVPVGASSGAGDEGVSAGAGAKGREAAKATMERLNKTTDLTKAQGSEEEKIMAMMNQAAKDYSEANYIVKTRAPPGQPPATYVCYRCGIKGHWIQNCPIQFQQKPDAMAFPGMLRGVKKTHGIPQSFLLPATKDTPGAMLTAIGTYAVPKMDAEAYARGKKEKPAFTENNDPALINPEKKIPKELLCTLCNELLRDATIVPCCGVSFCDECVRDSLVEGDDEQECPSCKDIIVPDQLIPNKFLRSAVTNFLSESNVHPRMHTAPATTAAMAAPMSKPLQPASSNSPAYGVVVKAEPSAPVTEEIRPATPVVDEKPVAVSSDQPAAAAPGVGQSSSGTSAGSSNSSTDNVQGQVVAVIGRKYIPGGSEGPSQRLSGMRGQLASRGSRQLGHASNSVHPPHAAILHGAPIMHGHLPYGVPRFRPMAPPIPTAAPPLAVGFGPRAAPFPMYPSATMPPVMYMPAAPQHMPGGPVLTAEEFYKEKARLLEEELHKQKKSDPLDDFARELLDYKKEQRKRQKSRSTTRSRSRSRKRSDSRSPKRRYRSRSRSRSRSPYYKRSPGFYRRSSRSPYQRRSPSAAVTPSPPLDFPRGMRSSSPFSRYHRSPPSRDKYMDEYYRRYLDDYFSRMDPHYDPRYFDEYYRNFYERYTRGSPSSDAYGMPSRAIPYASGYPLPEPHHDGERGSYDYRHDSDKRRDDVGGRYRGRNSGSRARNEGRLRMQPSGSRRRSRDRGPSTEKHPSRDSEGGKISKDSEKEKRTSHRDKKKRDERSSDKGADAQTLEKNVVDASSTGTTDKASGTATAAPDQSRSKQKKVDGKRKRHASGDRERSSGEDSQKRKRHSKSEKSEKCNTGDANVAAAAAASKECSVSAEIGGQVSSLGIELQIAEEHVNESSAVPKQDAQPLPEEKVDALVANSEHSKKESALGITEPQVIESVPVCAAPHEVSSVKQDIKPKRPRSPSGAGNKSKLKKKHKVSAGASALSSEQSPSLPVSVVTAECETGDKKTVESGAAALPGSNVLIKPPELSRWEREDRDSPERDASLLPKKLVEKVKPQSLPKSVIESAEKALMSKQPKPLVASAISTLSTSSSSNSTRPIGGAAVSSVGATSRKVFVGPNKDSAAAVAMAHEGGIAADRKVQSVASSVRITISQDKGFTEEDGCKDLREKLLKGKDNMPDTKEIRKTVTEKESKSEMGIHSKQNEGHRRRESKGDRRDDQEAEPCFGKDSNDNASVHEQDLKKKSSRDHASRTGEVHVSKGHRERYDVARTRGPASSAARLESMKSVLSGNESEIPFDAKQAKADAGKYQVVASSSQRNKKGHDMDGCATGSKCDGDVNDELKLKRVCSDSKQSQAAESVVASREFTPAPTAGLQKELTSDLTEPVSGSILSSKSQTVANGPIDKADTVASEPSSIRLSDEASFNPDYDETSTQSSGGSESEHGDDDDGLAVHGLAGRNKDGRTDPADGGVPDKQHSSDNRAKGSRSKHKKHKKHAKKHKKHKKHKKSSGTKVN